MLVDMPKVPENIEGLAQRCNYILDNYWKRANLKSAFSSHDRMDATFRQFLTFTPYATADTVHMAIDNLIKGVEKADARNLVPLARMAEKYCGTDTAEFASEELLLPFVQAVADSRKVKSPEKARYQALARKLHNSRLGATVADFEFTCPDGTTGHLSDVDRELVLLYFYDPDCLDCRLVRTRLSQDIAVKAFISQGFLKVIAIYPGEADAAWQEDTESMPDTWVIGANPEIDLDFTLERSPQMYLLDKDRKVMSKGFTDGEALRYFNQFIQPRR